MAKKQKNIIEKKWLIVKAKSKGRLPKVVIPVHLSGQSCEMDKIYSLSNEEIVEDMYGHKITLDQEDLEEE